MKMNFMKRDKKFNKVAICIGINKYPNPRNNLKGCVNDAKQLRSILIRKYNVDRTVLLLNRSATKNKVISAIKKYTPLISDDGHLIFTVSSHGTSIRDINGDENDGRDEAICLYDSLLIDDEFGKIIDQISKNIKITIITDCCHSGTITRNFLDQNKKEKYSKIRYMTPPVELIPKYTKKSPKIKKIFDPKNIKKIKNNIREILITGCKDNEYSYDAYFNGKYHGALTYNILSILKNGENLTYQDFYNLLQDRLPSRRFNQTPQFHANKHHSNLKLFE